MACSSTRPVGQIYHDSIILVYKARYNLTLTVFFLIFPFYPTSPWSPANTRIMILNLLDEKSPSVRKHAHALLFVHPAFQCIPEEICLHLHERWKILAGKDVYMALAHCHSISFGAG